MASSLCCNMGVHDGRYQGGAHNGYAVRTIQDVGVTWEHFIVDKCSWAGLCFMGGFLERKYVDAHIFHDACDPCRVVLLGYVKCTDANGTCSLVWVVSYVGRVITWLGACCTRHGNYCCTLLLLFFFGLGHMFTQLLKSSPGGKEVAEFVCLFVSLFFLNLVIVPTYYFCFG